MTSRRRTEIKKIDSKLRRQVTFCKRRNGLLKKAHELAVLCDAEVAVIIFSNHGQIYEYGSNNNGAHKTVERYQSNHKQEPPSQIIALTHRETTMEKLSEDIHSLSKSVRNLLGEDISELNMDELSNLECTLQNALTKVTSRKKELAVSTIQKLENHVFTLQMENERLYNKVVGCKQSTTMQLLHPLNQ